MCQSCGVTLRATLFDMDGLLFDTEVLWHDAELEIFGRLGVPIPEAENRSTKGMYVTDVVEYWYARYPWSGPNHDDVVNQLLERVGELVESQGQMMPGAIRALDLTSAHGPIALASSTPLSLIYRCLDHFNLRDRFASIHSAELEPYGKPHPGVFLMAADSLAVAAIDCLVIEDSAAGVLAAKSASMEVIAVPTPDDRSMPAFLLADLVLESLVELNPEWLDERFA